MEEKPVFDIEKFELAIGRCTDAFSELGLTLIEAIHVVKSLEVGLRIAIGPEDYEVCEKFYSELRAFEPPEGEREHEAGESVQSSTTIESETSSSLTAQSL